MQAADVARHRRATLSMVYDVDPAAAAKVAQREGARAARTPEEVFASPSVDAVLIATSTPTRADYVEMAVADGEAALCEKPVDLDIARVALCRRRIAGSKVPVQIGFNRRIDPGQRAARDAAGAGEIGQLHQVVITSRDPALPPRSYLTQAGGLFRDMTIHDFDLARFMLNNERARCSRSRARWWTQRWVRSCPRWTAPCSCCAPPAASSALSSASRCTATISAPNSSVNPGDVVSQ